MDYYSAKLEYVVMRQWARPNVEEPMVEISLMGLVSRWSEAIVSLSQRDYLDADNHLQSQGKTVVLAISPGENIAELNMAPHSTNRDAFCRC